jgi:cytochrome c biogenesis protein CcmG, thiol:disulfide interchange protein DsbE
VLNFFASWCGPCREELPLLARTDRKAAGQVRFVGVDVSDQDGPALTLVRSSGVSYPVGVDPSYQVSGNEYHLYGLPDTVFVDAAGHEVGMVAGPLTPTRLARWLGRIGVHLPTAALSS